MDIKTLENLISNRGMVKITDRHGWGAGRVGIALGYRSLYHSVKIGFVDENGNYTGEYTVVPVSAVERTDHGRLTLEEALTEAHTEWQIDQPAVVKIQYVDGTTEEIRNIPRGEIAAGIYAEVAGNDRVVRAELIRGDGTVARVYTVAPSILEALPRAEVADGVCGRHMGEELARRYGRRTLSACARVPGHRGRHFAALNGVKWTDDQCAPSTTEELAKRAGLDL